MANRIPLLLVLLFSAVGASAQERADLDRSLRVPLDHSAAEWGQGVVEYELGAPLDAAKPTVFVVADAQQFFLVKGSMARLQHDSFGPAFNVVGVLGRAVGPEFQRAAAGADGKTDWARAWRVFRSDQWVGDLEAVRRELLGPEGKVLLWGTSGGGFLAVEYLARHPERVSRAFISCAVTPFIVGEARLNSDRFREEIGRDPALLEQLKDAVKRHDADRGVMVMTLQRQNFFVPPDRLPAARAALISALANGDEQAYLKAQEEYQVGAVRALLDAPRGIAARVREYEFLYPTGLSDLVGGPTLYPDLENQYQWAEPLMHLADAGTILPPVTPIAGLHVFAGEVFILAGRWDHTTDYRSAIALASCFPHHVLFIADDDHMFGRLQGAGLSRRLQDSFLLGGLGSAEFQDAVHDAEPSRWRER